MSVWMLLALIAALAVAAYLGGYWRARQLSGGASGLLHSRPQFHGVYVAFLSALPALLVLLAWLLLNQPVLQSLLLASLPEEATNVDAGRLSLLVAEIRSVASGRIFGEPEPYVSEAAAYLGSLRTFSDWGRMIAVVAVGLVGAAIALYQIRPAMRARNRVEAISRGLLILASCIAILTTLGIVLSLFFESARFFAFVPVTEFLFGLNWEPQIPIREGQVAAEGAFGAVPVFWGTILIAFIAMLVAVPIGLFSAIYMAEYASPRVRGTVKPILEILAGVPTIVYGFFAVLTVSPFVRDAGAAIGLDIAPNSAFVAGAVMGIMIIPFVSSLSDDAITAVPRSLRDASLAMGATRGETVTKVLLPAALPGIVGGILLAVSRAIGETMIVVMAAGLTARLTLNPFEGVTTVTVQIVSLLTGDTSFDNPKTLSAFGLGLVLFLSTLLLNVYALNVVKKYREAYD
jgi:phosphate transport system permease protein